MTRFLFALALVAAACSAPDPTRDESSDAGTAGADTSRDAGSPVANPITSVRPFQLHVPTNYDASKATPLVILLHGYSATAAEQEAYFRLIPLADKETFLYAMPDGTVDQTNNRFWNATDACCDFWNVPVDDVAYVNAIIDDVSTRFHVDAKRVYLVGHSNGGFMSHRAACELSPRIAAIASLAGAQWKDQSHCVPTSPVSVLQVHGDLDSVILYGGGSVAVGVPPYPGAKETVADWAKLNGCDDALTDSGDTLDLDSVLLGAETTIARHEHCRAGAAELWTIHGGGHIPALTDAWAGAIWGFLKAHPKP